MDVTLSASEHTVRTRCESLRSTRTPDQYQNLGTDSSCNTRSFEPLIIRTPDHKNP